MKGDYELDGCREFMTQRQTEELKDSKAIGIEYVNVIKNGPKKKTHHARAHTTKQTKFARQSLILKSNKTISVELS